MVVNGPGHCYRSSKFSGCRFNTVWHAVPVLSANRAVGTGDGKGK